MLRRVRENQSVAGWPDSTLGYHPQTPMPLVTSASWRDPAFLELDPEHTKGRVVRSAAAVAQRRVCSVCREKGERKRIMCFECLEEGRRSVFSYFEYRVLEIYSKIFIDDTLRCTSRFRFTKKSHIHFLDAPRRTAKNTQTNTPSAHRAQRFSATPKNYNRAASPGPKQNTHRCIFREVRLGRLDIACSAGNLQKIERWTEVANRKEAARPGRGCQREASQQSATQLDPQTRRKT